MHIKSNILKFGNYSYHELIEKYGSPLFVYNQDTLETCCDNLRRISNKPNFRINYSCKANNSISLLKIIRDKGLKVDAMSIGEIFLEKQAGFLGQDILYISNNASKYEFDYAVENGVNISLDSISQIHSFGKYHSGYKIFIRINPGIGDGHHEKVITAGHSKFGIVVEDIDEAINAAKKYDLTIQGINMHIGSLFLKPDNYLSAIKRLLNTASKFKNLKYIDFGGGIGIPYRQDEPNFPFEYFSKQFNQIINEWEQENNKYDVTFIIEPGRYVVAQSGVLLCTVNSIKTSYGIKYIGTDLGFNLLIRPEFYDAYHKISVCSKMETDNNELVSICGNICESGDFIGKDRLLPEISIGDNLIVYDVGAYGFSMSSNYNARLRPAEILITKEGNVKVIRENEDLNQLLINQIY